MEKVKMRFASKRALLIFFALILLCAFLSGFYFYTYHYYEFYGFVDSMRLSEKWVLKCEKYDADELAVLSFSDFDIEDTLVLVNMEYPLGDDSDPTLVSVGDEHWICENIYDELLKLFDACFDATGEELSITSSFRTFENQEAIYAVNEFAVPPGASEHQCGLAVDVRTDEHASLNFIKSDAGRWLAKNAHKYGFIIRYPYWGEDETGVTYEPWHLRYVGEPHAQIIYRTKIVLEEYDSLYKDGEFYLFENYVISHQDCEEGTFLFPSNAENIVISSDNMGGYFIWGEIA